MDKEILENDEGFMLFFFIFFFLFFQWKGFGSIREQVP